MMGDEGKRKGPLKWASKLLRIPNPDDYDAWSDSSLQDIEWIVRRACVCASENDRGCQGEFLAARERLLQEWLGQCQAMCAGRSEDWSPGSSSRGGVLAMAHVRSQTPQENDCGIQRSHSTPLSHVAVRSSRYTMRGARSRKMMAVGPSPSDSSYDQVSSHISRMGRDEISTGLSLDTPALQPNEVNTFKSKMQRAFRKADGASTQEETCTSPLLSDF